MRSATSHPLRKVLLVLVCVACVYGIVFFIRSKRDADQFKNEVDWVRKTIQELETSAPPPAQTNESWIAQDYLLFTNGWAAYRIHSAHAMDGMDDLALLRFSDGRIYFSPLHYCVGIDGWMPENLRETAPADADDFLQRHGIRQAWHLLAPHDHPSCLVFVYDQNRSDGSTKKFRVWIGFETNNPATLFEKHYELKSHYLSWSTEWPSKDRIIVDLYDYDTGVRPYSEPAEAILRTNFLRSLTFVRDVQGGQFVESPE